MAPPRDDDPTVELESGSQMLGPYLLQEQVGQGGMGVVYRAVDRAGDEVAVKVLRPHIAHDDSARDRLRREVTTLSRVRDDRVAAVLDADIDGPTPYLVTRFVAGPPLDDVVGEGAALSPEQLVTLGRGLAEALGAIHAAGVVHRDLKPGNVLMDGDEPVLIDFGIAHVADDVRLTMTGMVMGTPGYLSPEVVEGAPVTEATDWWGWAATLAYAASGHAPFGRGPMPVILDRVSRGQCDLSGVDDRLRPLLESALSPVPDERPAAATVLAELEEYAAGRHTTGVPVRAAGAAAGAAAAGAAAATASPSTERLENASTGATPRASQTQQQPVGHPDPTAELPAASATQATPAPTHDPHSVPQPLAPTPQPLAPGASGPVPQPWLGGQQSDPRIGQPSRTWSLALLLAALLGLTALWPVVGLVLLILWSVAARWVDRSMTAQVVRRFKQGSRRSDGVVALVSSPWHGVRAVLATAFAIIVPLFVGAVATITTALLISLSDGSSPELDSAPPWVVGLLVATCVLWWGPGGTSMRRGSRSVVRGVLRTEPLTVIVLALCGVLGFGALLWSLQNGFEVDWWPISDNAEWLRGDWIPSLRQ